MKMNGAKILIESAEKAGVKKIVHISITNANEESKYAYFQGKGVVERLIKESSLDYAILRPALIFGRENVLINNIAVLLKKSLFFGIFGDGKYKLQPIYVGDLAQLAVDAGHKDENMVVDALGPETFTFNEFVYLINDKIGSNAQIRHLPVGACLRFALLIGKFAKDVVVTEDEVEALMDGLLYTGETANGKTKFSSWLDKNSNSIGIDYMSQLKMHFVE